MQCLNFFQQADFKLIDPKDFDWNKYSSNSSKGCVLEVDFKYPKELRKLHNDYSLALDKIKIKKEMLSKWQLMISDFYNIPISNVKKLMPKFFGEEKYVLYYGNLKLYLSLWLKLKKYIVH